MAVGKTSLSAGEIIRGILINDAEVAARTNKVFPVVEDSAEDRKSTRLNSSH